MNPAFVYILSFFLLLFAGGGVYLFIHYSSYKKKLAHSEIQTTNYRNLIDQANDAMLVIDIVNGKILQTNPAAGELLNYKEEELISKTLFDLHPQEHLQESSKVVADVWEKGGLIYNHIPFKRKDGTCVPVECSAKVAPYEGKPSIVIYARDITERLKLETEIREQQQIIKEKNKDIIDSINYSRRIQSSLLPSEAELKKAFDDYFVLYKPKDIVSGDFYWCINTTTSTTNARMSVIGAVDCTGHGVPGAFMSLIGHMLLNQTIKNPDINSPADVLDFLNKELPKNIKTQEGEYNLRDGMDMSLCAIDFNANKLYFAGANNPLWIVRKGITENQNILLNTQSLPEAHYGIIELKPDKQAVSASDETEKKPFNNQMIDVQKNDCIYLFSDGYADQFGGPKGKKFMYKRMKEMLIANAHLSMNEQKQILSKANEDWKGDLEQVDDVLVIGIKII